MAEKEYIEREAVLSVLDEAVKTWRPDIGISKAEYFRIRYKNIPAAYVRPVVLCRDCKNYIERSGACAYLVVGMREDDFCSYGKKREES